MSQKFRKIPYRKLIKLKSTTKEQHLAVWYATWRAYRTVPHFRSFVFSVVLGASVMQDWRLRVKFTRSSAAFIQSSRVRDDQRCLLVTNVRLSAVYGAPGRPADPADDPCCAAQQYKDLQERVTRRRCAAAAAAACKSTIIATTALAPLTPL